MDRLLTVKEVAEKLQSHPQTIYRNKVLPSEKIPGVGIRFKESALEKYLDQITTRPGPFIPFPLITHPTNLTKLKNPPARDIMLPGGIGELAKAKSKTRINFGYGAIYTRKTKSGFPRFYLEYYDAEGKRKQVLDKNALTWEDAAAALRNEVLREQAKKFGYEQKREKIGFDEFAQIYLEDYMKVERKSWISDQYRLSTLKQYFKGKELREITPLMIQRFRDSRLKAGNMKSTTNRYLALLKRMFNVAIEEGYVEQNPVKKVKFYSEKDTLKERILSEDEQKRLIQASSGHLKSILIIALNTGMRIGEILSLQWSQIDLDPTTPKVRVERTKSGKMRFIPINDDLFEELQNLKTTSGQNNFLFFNPLTKKSMARVTRAFKTACRRADIPELRFHDTRHTLASRLIAAGVDIETVRSILGHSSLSVTQRYVHSGDDARRKAVELLNTKSKDRAKQMENLLHRRYTEKKNLQESLFPYPANALYSEN